jgi:ribosome-binding factor A
VPSLTFLYDESLEREQRVAQVLDELQIEAPLPEADSDLATS